MAHPVPSEVSRRRPRDSADQHVRRLTVCRRPPPSARQAGWEREFGSRRPLSLSWDDLHSYDPKVVKYVVFYESADDVASKAPPHFPAHRARLDEFHADGRLLLVGTFANPQEEGSMAIFSTREAAEEFVKDDPFVVNGVVKRWYIREWNEIFSDGR